jgi:hypothetical protein
VHKGVKLCRECGLDFVLAVRGGSAIVSTDPSPAERRSLTPAPLAPSREAAHSSSIRRSG